MKKPEVELAEDGQLMSYRIMDCGNDMDAMRDKIELEDLWLNNKACGKSGNGMCAQQLTIASYPPYTRFKQA